MLDFFHLFLGVFEEFVFGVSRDFFKDLLNLFGVNSLEWKNCSLIPDHYRIFREYFYVSDYLSFKYLIK